MPGEVRNLFDRYLDLIRSFPLRPIRTDEELDQAVAVIDSLIDRDLLRLDEQDYLDVLADQVERYETERHPLPAVSEVDMLRHLIEARDITQLRLATDTGIAESTISNLLKGKRGMSRKHVEILAAYFRVSPAVFLGRTNGPRKQIGNLGK
jgi:HTH-type transcriptional regulator / antitoxin HigA